MRGRAIALILLTGLLICASLSDTQRITIRMSEVLLANNTIHSQTTEPLVINGNLELAQESSGGVGTRSDPYRIQPESITADATCVRIENTTAFFVLQGGEYNIRFEDDIEGLSSTISQPVIILNHVEHGIIRNCLVSGGRNGIELNDSQDCTIDNCTIKKTEQGISLNVVDNCTIRDSRIFHNEDGIELQVATNLKIFNNIVYGNAFIGIKIGFYNENNSIYLNKIGWNRERNALDNGDNNSFISNSWSDYNGIGAYTIYGVKLSTDVDARSWRDTVPPTVGSLADVVIDVESTEEYLSWRCYDDYSDRYAIYINDVLEIQDLWDEEVIILRIDQLPVGTYDIILNVTDAAGNADQDSVMVTVISYMLGGIGTELVMLASGLTVVVFLVTILVIKKVG